MAGLASVFTPEFWALETLQQLYKKSQMLNLVNRDFDNIVAARGDVINTRMPGKIATRPVNLAVPFSATEPGADNVQIKLDQWVETVPYKIDDKTKSLAIVDLVRLFVEPAAEAIVQVVEEALIGLYRDIPTVIGTPGVVPNDVSKFGTDVKQAFDDQIIPKANRRVILNSSAANQFSQKLWKVNEVGTSSILTEGALGRIFGSDYFDSQYLPTHTQGGWDGSVVVATGGAAAGAGLLSVTGLTTGTVFRGDHFSIDHTAAGVLDEWNRPVGVVNYTVTADTPIVANAAVVPIYPPLKANVLAAVALTASANYGVNLAFHRDAFTIVSRPLESPTGTGALVSVMNYGGIGIRATIWYEPKDRCHYVSLDLLFGVKTLDPRKAFILAG